MRKAVAIATAALALTLATAGCTTMDQEETPTASPTASPPASALPTPAPPLTAEELERFTGVAMMNAGGNCTGTVIDTGVASGPAYVLTNGHCVGDLGRAAQSTTLGLDWFGEAEFFRIRGNLDGTLTVPVVQIAYSTMRYTDTAIVRLDTTLADLEARGVTPIKIADAEPTSGASVTNIGVPVQGMLDDEWVMRKGQCTLGEQHTLIEFTWLWRNVWSNDCPGIIQGSSGSPLLETDASGTPTQIVGVINTTSWGTSQAEGGACAINRPCQVAADGTVTMVEETSYAQSVAGIGACFDASSGEFALTPSCPLPTSNIWAESGGGAFRGGDLPDSAGRIPWATIAGPQAGTFRWTVTPMGDASACADPATYVGAASAPLPVGGEVWEDKGQRVEPDLPQVEGWYLLCAVNGDDYAKAASVLFQVDRTPPIFAAAADLERQDDGAVLVHPHMRPPEIVTNRYLVGPKGTVDCDDTAAFQTSMLFFTWVTPDQLPATFCLIGMDSAGNTTPVTKIEIPAP